LKRYNNILRLSKHQLPCSLWSLDGPAVIDWIAKLKYSIQYLIEYFRLSCAATKENQWCTMQSGIYGIYFKLHL